jgi:thymidylate synthase (FAD)|tara:strand:+ start:263 stop:928 length:666 start_codon:yes stop_codon:yes gene_type:complete
MKVKLVGITKPVNQDYGETTENIVSYCARVSNPKNQKNFTTSSKLLSYMIREGHWSPFEMVHLTIEIETTRDIARQILRHRSFAFQEFSQRYADPTKELKFVDREARLQDPKNRQNSLELDTDSDLHHAWKQEQLNVVSSAMDTYNWAIKNGIAKEQARAVLPEGLIESRLYMSGNLRSWIHYCQLRMGHGTQLEHINIAKKCWNILEKEFPEVTDAVNNL